MYEVHFKRVSRKEREAFAMDASQRTSYMTSLQQWVLARISLSEAFAFFFLSSEAEITEKTNLCDLAMGHRSH